ncbi:MAG TPA: lysophospholipid acyltransferase family protein [Marinobacter sp.]|uniref:lysophospholipid acyltransferase family protein n=1 Tax=Marinobacter sp. TaxID=50741 RepID=UPI002D7F3730|nr:lysophospholipid acyltransferase family protein [Marinobacter sp.]HET8800624.1 lysophospholipid acyltransferase family protein [Marinobacter sp.]
MEWIRLATRLTAFALFLLATGLLALTLLLTERVTGTLIDRTPWARRCFRWACRCLGLDVRVHGVPRDQRALFVCNHISWSDIPILGSLMPIRFLSKAEVGQWPVIGWLARQAGTLFIRRGGGQARQVRTRISQALATGESVLIFPEGTTSAGLTVLPFHGLLLQAASEAGAAIQPVTISYRRNSRPDHLAPFVGEDRFEQHLLRMLRQPAAQVDVLFHDPVATCPGTATAELTAQLQHTVLNGLKCIQAGERDTGPRNPPVRTAGDPGRLRLPWLRAGRRFQDQNTG